MIVLLCHTSIRNDNHDGISMCVRIRMGIRDIVIMSMRIIIRVRGRVRGVCSVSVSVSIRIRCR